MGPEAVEATPALLAVVADSSEDETLRCHVLEVVATIGGAAQIDRRAREALKAGGGALKRCIELLDQQPDQ